LDVLEELVAELLVRMESDGAGALEAFCSEHPEKQAALRQRVGALEKLGLLEFKDGPAVAGESVPERIGPYLIRKELGRGGQGVVYLAEEEALSRLVALKVFAPGLLANREARIRFRREAEAASRLDHPNVCAVYGFGEEQGYLYMAMRYVEGETLADWLAGLRSRAGPARGKDRGSDSGSSGTTNAEISQALVLVEKIARALHAAHELGLIHRDVKPGNIMLTKEGEPVILDFGLARDETSDRTVLTQTGAIVGTPAYMSPEQVAGRDSLDRRTDVYALGVILYECLTLERPFHAPDVAALYRVILATDPKDPRRLNPRLSRDATVVIAKALDKDPAHRYPTALALADELQRLLNFEPIQARPASILLRLRRWGQRRPMLAATTVGLFLSLSVGLVGSLVLIDRVDSARQRSEGLRLAPLSAALVDDQPDLALLLALEVAELQPGRVANEALLAALMTCRLERILQGPGGSIEQVSLDRAGKRALARSVEGLVRVWDLTSGEVLSGGVEELLMEAVVATLFPDGESVALGHRDGSLSIVDLTMGLVQEVEGFAPFSHLLAHPDGMRLLAIFKDGSAHWLDKSGQRLGSLRPPGNKVLGVDISRDGSQLALALEGGAVEIRDGVTGSELALLRGGNGDAVACAFDPTGRRLVVSSVTARSESADIQFNDALRVWDLSSAELLMERHGDYERFRTVAFAENGTVLGGDSLATRLISADSGENLLKLTGNQGPASSVHFLPGGTRAVTGSRDGTLRLWNLGPQPEVTIFRGHEKGVSPARFDPSGTSLVTAAEDGTCRVWDVATGQERLRLESCASAIVFPATFSPDGSLVAYSCQDGSVHINDAESGRLLYSIAAHTADVFGLQFDPGGGFLACASFDGTGSIIDLATGEVCHVLEGHTDKIHNIRYDSAGERLVSASEDGSARLWDADTGENLAILEGHPGMVFDARFSPRGDLILTACEDGCARLFRTEAGEVRREAQWVTPIQKGRIWRAAFSPDGESFACISLDFSVANLFSTRDATLIASMEGHEGGIVELAFSPDGRYLATGSMDGTARIWEVSDGSPWLTCRGHSNFVLAVDFSRDGRHMVSASADGTARLWPVDPHAAAQLRRPRELTAAERERFGLESQTP
jgi:WD40 repeat protein/serine/threonine protein kinase